MHDESTDNVSWDVVQSLLILLEILLPPPPPPPLPLTLPKREEKKRRKEINRQTLLNIVNDSEEELLCCNVHHPVKDHPFLPIWLNLNLNGFMLLVTNQVGVRLVNNNK